jgi:hypothetical protein
MKTFAEIVDDAIKKGFECHRHKKYYILTFKKKHGIRIEITFTNDKELDSLEDGIAISWDFKLIDDTNGKVIYKDWREHYGNGVNILLNEMREDISELIYNLSTYDFKIVNKSGLKIFGFNLLKHKELIFINPNNKTEDETM